MYNDVAATFSLAVVIIEGLSYLNEFYRPNSSIVVITLSPNLIWEYWELVVLALLLVPLIATLKIS